MMTRFLILMAEDDHFARWEGADEATQQRHLDALHAFTVAVRERGHYLGGEALVAPTSARTLRPSGEGRRKVTDGPYAETAAQLGGFYLVELADLATALELVVLLPAEYEVEVRECLDVGVPDAELGV